MIVFALIFIVGLAYIYVQHTFINTTPKSSKKHWVLMRRKSFTKTKLTIDENDTILFVNADIVRHQVLNDSNTIPNSLLLSPRDIFKITLTNEGTYKFYSGLYDTMNQCLVTVQSTQSVMFSPAKNAEIKNKIDEKLKSVYNVFK